MHKEILENNTLHRNYTWKKDTRASVCFYEIIYRSSASDSELSELDSLVTKLTTRCIIWSSYVNARAHIYREK